jgi:hypothetical protein
MGGLILLALGFLFVVCVVLGIVTIWFFRVSTSSGVTFLALTLVFSVGMFASHTWSLSLVLWLASVSVVAVAGKHKVAHPFFGVVIALAILSSAFVHRNVTQRWARRDIRLAAAQQRQKEQAEQARSAAADKFAHRWESLRIPVEVPDAAAMPGWFLSSAKVMSDPRFETTQYTLYYQNLQAPIAGASDPLVLAFVGRPDWFDGRNTCALFDGISLFDEPQRHTCIVADFPPYKPGWYGSNIITDPHQIRDKLLVNYSGPLALYEPVLNSIHSATDEEFAKLKLRP